MPRTKKIMVVDDEPGIRNLLFDVLSGEGFKVTLAKDGKDSLSQMKKDRFDLVITDINMPHLDGIELLKKMKKAGRKERIIIMTGKSFDMAHFKKDIPPIADELRKPFHMNNFLEAVSSVLAPVNSRKNKSVKPFRRKRKAINAV